MKRSSEQTAPSGGETDARGVSLVAFPMHGYYKMLTEGYRTRDAHLLEWFSAQVPEGTSVFVSSRPEPFPLQSVRLARSRAEQVLPRTIDASREIFRLPSLRNPKRWWLDALPFYRLPRVDGVPSVIWNPTIALSSPAYAWLRSREAPIHLDLLDDWSVHAAFEPIRGQVTVAYEKLFDLATSVTANSEGTLRLAQKHGRSDAILVPNGCDPERFDARSTASGRTTVGYLGKIGLRLDSRAIIETVRQFPDWRFVFAGQVLERETGNVLRREANIDMLGDVQYRNVPTLLQTFDLGWVPHDVEHGQVGGDAIKIYEYRAAGLPVLTSPIIGTRERPMVGVTVASMSNHAEHLRGFARNDRRIDRVIAPIPPELTWRYKAHTILEQVGLATPGGAADA